LVSDESTGAQRFSGHTFRVTGAMYLASCGIDIWRIQLHCRWGSSSVLRYVRPAPLSGSVALEASLGRDLKHVERSIIAAKAELAALKSTSEAQLSLQEHLETALGPELSSAAGALGKPDVNQILECRAKAWHRDPTIGEVLALNTSRWTKGGFHSMRPPVVSSSDFDMAAFLARCSERGQKTWCGWKFTLSEECEMSIWDDTLAKPEFCDRWFGKKPRPDDPSSASSSSSSQPTAAASALSLSAAPPQVG